MPSALPAARHQHDHFLALDQAFGTPAGVYWKVSARAGDIVDIALELGRQVEVVDRHGEHDAVGREQLGDQAVGRGRDGLLRVAAGVGRGEQRADGGAVEVRHGSAPRSRTVIWPAGSALRMRSARWSARALELERSPRIEERMTRVFPR